MVKELQTSLPGLLVEECSRNKVTLFSTYQRYLDNILKTRLDDSHKVLLLIIDFNRLLAVSEHQPIVRGEPNQGVTILEKVVGVSGLLEYCNLLETTETYYHGLALVGVHLVQHLQVPLTGRQSHRVNVVAVFFQQQNPFLQIVNDQACFGGCGQERPLFILEEKSGDSEDGVSLLDILGVGGSEKESLFASDDKLAGSLVVLDGILPTLGRFDCLHLIIIVETNQQSKNFTCSPFFDYLIKLIGVRWIMKNQLDVELIEKLPTTLRRLLKKPQAKRIPFDSLSQNNAEKAANYVKTKTMVDLFSPPSLSNKIVSKTDKPIILIFCQPSEEIPIGSKGQILPFAPISYPTWLQAAGAHCIPFPHNINEGSMLFLLERAHGLLIPGGGANLYRNWDNKEGSGPMTIGFLKMWRHIQKMWARGINFPIWGTCLGLEIMMIVLTGDTKILSQLNNRGYQGEIYSEYQNSTLLKDMPHDLRLNMQNRKLLNFHHVYGISVKKFQNTPKLVQKLKITGISKDQDGKWFCNFLEGRDRPIFLSQCHPEKQAFQWSTKGDVVNHKHSIEICQFISQSFVQQCMKCKNQKAFLTIAELQFYAFQQFRQIFTPQKLYRVYAIDFKFRDYDKEHKKKISEKQIGATSSKKVFI